MFSCSFILLCHTEEHWRTLWNINLPAKWNNWCIKIKYMNINFTDAILRIFSCTENSYQKCMKNVEKQFRPVKSKWCVWNNVSLCKSLYFSLSLTINFLDWEYYIIKKHHKKCEEWKEICDCNAIQNCYNYYKKTCREIKM